MHFVHLGIHTEFSITESIVRIPDLIKAAVNDEMPALALTDLSNLHAAVKFYTKCLDKGIKPILGSNIRLNDAEHKVTLLSMTNKPFLPLSFFFCSAVNSRKVRPILLASGFTGSLLAAGVSD